MKKIAALFLIINFISFSKEIKNYKIIQGPDKEMIVLEKLDTDSNDLSQENENNFSNDNAQEDSLGQSFIDVMMFGGGKKSLKASKIKEGSLPNSFADIKADVRENLPIPNANVEADVPENLPSPNVDIEADVPEGIEDTSFSATESPMPAPPPPMSSITGPVTEAYGAK